VARGYFRVAQGVLHHSVGVIAGDECAQEARFNLGFGRHVSAAGREGTGPVDGARSDAAGIHAAAREDVGVVAELARTLGLHHLGSPMFMCWPVLPEHEPFPRGFLGSPLEGDENPHFVAPRGVEAVGMASFMRKGFVPPHLNPDKNVYLSKGIVQPEAQNDGVGRALLDPGMAAGLRTLHAVRALRQLQRRPVLARQWVRARRAQPRTSCRRARRLGARPTLSAARDRARRRCHARAGEPATASASGARRRSAGVGAHAPSASAEYAVV